GQPVRAGRPGGPHRARLGGGAALHRVQLGRAGAERARRQGGRPGHRVRLRRRATAGLARADRPGRAAPATGEGAHHLLVLRRSPGAGARRAGTGRRLAATRPFPGGGDTVTRAVAALLAAIVSAVLVPAPGWAASNRRPHPHRKPWLVLVSVTTLLAL